MSNEYLRKLLELQAGGTPLAEIIEKLRLFRLVVVATEWGAMKGGVSTFNGNLCKGLATLGHSVLVAIIRNPDGRVHETLPRYEGPGELKFMLLNASPTSDEMREVIEFPPDLVVGHDRFTGSVAIALASNIAWRPRSAVFIHVDPIIELHKNAPSSRRVGQRESRERWQKNLIRRADIAISVGPRLGRHTSDVIEELPMDSRPDHIVFVPGLDARDPPEPAQTLRGPDYRIASFGRMEDAELKGQDILRNAVGALMRAEGKHVPTVKFMGGDADDVWERYRSDEVPEHMDWRQFSDDPDLVTGFMRKAHVLVMPSREEGFGLVALEAVAANRPVVASSNSGFAEWLRFVADRELPELRPSLPYFIVEFQKGGAGVMPGESLWIENLSAALLRIYLEYDAVVAAVDTLRRYLEAYGWSRRCDDLAGQLRPLTRPVVTPA